MEKEYQERDDDAINARLFGNDQKDFIYDVASPSCWMATSVPSIIVNNLHYQPTATKKMVEMYMHKNPESEVKQ